MANALTKTVDGKPLTADQFAYVGDPKNIESWHLPLDTHQHVNSALDMFAHTDLPSSAKGPTARKIAAKAKEENLDTTDFVKNHLPQTFAEAASPWIEVFRAGDYRDKGKGLITRADLDRVVRNYDPTYHEAPVTIGHPSNDKPAFGWIERLAVDGDTLLAKEKQVDPQFHEARKAGRYKKRSAAFYQDASGQITSLRHVAYLGAAPPEVKGLQDVAFDDHGLEFIEVDFGEDEPVAGETKTVAEQIKAFFAEAFGSNVQPKTFSEDDLKSITGEALANAAKAFDAKVIALQSELATQTAKFTEREKLIAGGEVKQRAVEAAARLKTAGKWLPAFDKMGLGLEFGEGDAKKSVTPLETLVLFLEGLPKIVPSGRVFEAAAHARGGNSSGDPLTDAARVRQKEKKITFSEALDEVAAEQPELAVAGRTTAGSI